MTIPPQEIMGNSAILDQLSRLNPTQTRDRVRGMTAGQLDDLVANIETDTVPRSFADSQVREAMDQRLAQVDVSEATKSKWQSLRSSVETHTAEVEKAAEAKFNKEFYKKGGFLAVLATAFTSLLAYFGFKKAKAIKEKGIFRSAMEGTKEHPILAALLAGMGIATGSAAYNYFRHNENSIVGRIKDEAASTGQSEEEVTRTFAEKLHGVVDNSTVNIAAGVARVLGGKFDPETGTVTLFGGALLRHPVVTVYRAGKRLDMAEKRGVSKYVLDRRLDAILSQTKIVGAEVTTGAVAKNVLAKRAQDLLRQGVLPRGATRQSNELDRILKSLTPDMEFKASDLAEEIRLRPIEAEAKLRSLEVEMSTLSKKGVADYGAMKSKVSNTMSLAEEKLRRGTDIGNLDDFKRSTLNDVRGATEAFELNVNDKKLAISSQITDAMNALSDPQGKGRQHLDTVARGRTTRILDGTTRRMEKIGFSIASTTPGKYIGRGLIGFSLLPIALEGLAALSPGEKGKAAAKAFKNDLIETGGGFIPVVGEIMDFKAAVMGTDMNGRELSSMQRVTAGAMGVLGSASIVLGFFTGGASVIGFRALRGALATRKAVKFAKMASNGEQIMDASRALKLVKQTEKNAAVLRRMQQTTKLQRRAQRLRRFVRNGQRTVQVATYAHLGYQLTSGAVNLIANAPAAVDAGRQKIHEGIDAAGEFVDGKITA